MEFDEKCYPLNIDFKRSTTLLLTQSNMARLDVNALLNVAPESFDPEDEYRNDVDGSDEEPRENDENMSEKAARQHYVDVGPSQMRRKARLTESDVLDKPQYQSVKASRAEMFGDDMDGSNGEEVDDDDDEKNLDDDEELYDNSQEDAEGEDTEEEENDDDEKEIPLDSLPSSASLSEQALASRHNRIRINNTEAMQRVYEDMRLDGPSTSGKMPWIETMSLVYEHATADEVPDAQNDLDRELSFYRQSLAAAIRGRELVLAAKVSFSRPNDYFAEMVKTDEHMERVRQRLLDESASIKASEDAKRQRELKKYGKKIQTEKLFERQRSKRDMQEKVNALKRKRQTGLDMDDDEFDVQLEEALGERKASQRTQRGPNKKRQYRDEKYGFGGKKRHNKSNTAESTDQVGPSRRKPGQRPKGGKAKRPGKARRAARR